MSNSTPDLEESKHEPYWKKCRGRMPLQGLIMLRVLATKDGYWQTTEELANELWGSLNGTRKALRNLISEKTLSKTSEVDQLGRSRTVYRWIPNTAQEPNAAPTAAPAQPAQLPPVRTFLARPAQKKPTSSLVKVDNHLPPLPPSALEVEAPTYAVPLALLHANITKAIAYVEERPDYFIRMAGIAGADELRARLLGASSPPEAAHGPG